jgi:hypothetical protein
MRYLKSCQKKRKKNTLHLSLFFKKRKEKEKSTRKTAIKEKYMLRICHKQPRCLRINFKLASLESFDTTSKTTKTEKQPPDVLFLTSSFRPAMQ